MKKSAWNTGKTRKEPGQQTRKQTSILLIHHKQTIGSEGWDAKNGKINSICSYNYNGGNKACKIQQKYILKLNENNTNLLEAVKWTKKEKPKKLIKYEQKDEQKGRS